MSTKRKADGGEEEANKRRPVDALVPPPPVDLALMQAQLAAQIAAASVALQNVQVPAPAQAKPVVKKAAFHALRLDAQGREIDEQGNLVKQEGPIKTISLNISSQVPQKKKENPYLAHRAITASKTAAAGSSGSSGSGSSSSSSSRSTLELSTAADDDVMDASGVDDRIAKSSRDARAKRAFKFAEAGKYVELEEAERLKEERRIRSGASSGRRAPELVGSAADAASQAKAETIYVLSQPADEGNVPTMEWWDEAFLPKDKRDARKTNRAVAEHDDFELLQLTNSKTYKYIQHPVPTKQLGGERVEKPMPMFLTKKERKRIRKSRRQEVEQEKRDKQMMGLIPAPEPKFKLSNFMKILGDQAIADPSKVEQRVMQQIKQREIMHEMRNLAAKLTPAQRREKRAKKAQEALVTARRIDVAAFRVTDLSNPRHRFKVDMNAQQHFLTGTVVLCAEAGVNLVYVEGGPKAIRKFVRLMLHRVKWDAPMDEDIKDAVLGENGGGEGMDEDDGEGAGDEDNDDEDDSDDEDGDKVKSSLSENKCDLVWQGVVAHRTFSGFKFQVRYYSPLFPCFPFPVTFKLPPFSYLSLAGMSDASGCQKTPGRQKLGTLLGHCRGQWGARLLRHDLSFCFVNCAIEVKLYQGCGVPE